MKSTLLASIALLTIASTCSAQTPLFPRHIEQATYPVMALTALVQGKVTLNVTIGEDGHVTQADAVSGPPLLLAAALSCIRRWTFDPPAAGPVTETFVYEFRIENQPYKRGECSYRVLYEVTYDLPERATLVAKVWRAPDVATEPRAQ